jgi:nitrogen fixation NifU-like protein
MNTQTSDLQDIYRRRVLEHSRHPLNFGRPESVDQEATGFNPLCGDKLSVYLQVCENNIRRAAFEGTGCAICMASASIMTEALKGQPLAHALQMTADVHRMFADGSPVEDTALKEIEALASVRHYPSRIKCATLAWTTFAAALSGDAKQVSTEN